VGTRNLVAQSGRRNFLAILNLGVLAGLLGQTRRGFPSPPPPADPNAQDKNAQQGPDPQTAKRVMAAQNEKEFREGVEKLYAMATDGLLPKKFFAEVHPRFRTPYVSSITVGLFVAIFASLIPIGILGELVSIGTLLAFVIVCAGVWMLRRRRPDLQRPFRTPLVPLVPILGIIVSGYLMLSLPFDTWLRMIIWLILGLAIYFGYGRKHSRVAELARSPQHPPTKPVAL